MNGADRLCDVLLVNGIDVCFANPGTSEMHFVAALDRKPAMRCVLGLSEGVVTGAADGYGRMADKPAATLLHLGPGLANGLANLHNARRASTPIVNVVGDHATYHLEHDAPLTSDIDSLARPMSPWVGRARTAADVQPQAEEAIRAAVTGPGISTLILPADTAWGELPTDDVAATEIAAPLAVDDAAIAQAVERLRKARKPLILLGGKAMRADALEIAGRIAAATGAALMTKRAARWQRGAGRVSPRPVPYAVDMAVEALKEFDAAILIGGRVPVAFFAYPGKPGLLLPEGCDVFELASEAHDLPAALAALAEGLGATKHQPVLVQQNTARDLATPSGPLTAEAISLVVARLLPENAIVSDESITGAGRFGMLAPTMAPFDHLALTGGAIGQGIPVATGAAVACPDRKVVSLQADGSGMYTLQGL